MTHENKEYELKSVEDFTKIPADKRDECLEDFKTWLEVYDEVNKSIFGKIIVIKPDHFTWIDDGKRGISKVEITIEDKK